MSQRKNEFNFHWTIKNYSFCDQRNGQGVSSPDFKADNLDECCWSIRLYPRGFNVECKGYVSLFFDTYWNKPFFFAEAIDVNVKLLNADDEVIFAEEKHMSGDTCEYKILKALKIEELEKKMKQSSTDTLVIQYRLSMKIDPTIQNATKRSCAAETTILFDQFLIDWNVYKESEFDFPIKRLVTHNHTPKFEITIETPEDDVMIKIRRLEKNNIRDHKVKCHIFSLGYDKQEILSCCDTFFFSSESHKENTWNFPFFFKRSFLVEQERLYDFNLKFNFFVSNGEFVRKYIEETKIDVPSSSSKAYDNPAMDSLMSEWNNKLLTNVKYADVKLRVEKEVISAHKVILATRSPVFSVMFDQDMIENRTGTIEISDMSTNAMKLFLKFLYSGMLDELEGGTMLELLLAAEKYEIPFLKEKCSSFLILHLDIDVIYDVVTVADMIGHANLKAAAVDFIREHTEEILGSPKWPKWFEKNVKLGSEIVCKLSKFIKNAS